mmetsp:Transcript_61707/g.108407  ORF Transcript_61707/g.108407 Transcript_61707/m.108407 type:complete len:204 (-) Transcript_61707:997-1608(-)
MAASEAFISFDNSFAAPDISRFAFSVNVDLVLIMALREAEVTSKAIPSSLFAGSTKLVMAHFCSYLRNIASRFAQSCSSSNFSSLNAASTASSVLRSSLTKCSTSAAVLRLKPLLQYQILMRRLRRSAGYLTRCTENFTAERSTDGGLTGTGATDSGAAKAGGTEAAMGALKGATTAEVELWVGVVLLLAAVESVTRTVFLLF